MCKGGPVPTDASGASGTRAAVVGDRGAPLRGEVVASLRRVGAEVVELAGTGGPGTHRGVDAGGVDLAERDAVLRWFDGAGRLDALVVVPAVDGGGPRPLAAMDDDEFARAWELPVLATLWCLQGGFRAFGGHPGRVVVVLPTTAMAGSGGAAVAAAAAEAQRLLAKSAARQWGPAGVTVNCVATGTAALGGRPLPGEGLGLARAALDLDLTAVGDLIVSLLGPGARALTGATLCADGGLWMAP